MSDPDWILVGVAEDYGFAPSNYIEFIEATPSRPPLSSRSTQKTAAPVAAEPERERGPDTSHSANSSASPIQGPAASLARVLGGGGAVASRSTASASLRQLTPEPSDDDEPAPDLPRRPPSQQLSPPPAHSASPPEEEDKEGPPGVIASPPHNRVVHREVSEDVPIRSPGGYHLYNVNEMVSAMGKRKKMPTTLGLNVATGTIMISPEKSRDGPSQEWTGDKMTHYSIEGKHVFLELIRPSKSLDLHAGAKDTAEEIVSTLGEIAGAARGEGIREVIAAVGGGGGTKRGHMLYDFMAQGDDEVTVAVGDDVTILDDTKSEEWWMVRRLKNGSEGVVPSSYVEVTDSVPTEPASRSGINAGRSMVEQNRLEEERLAKEATKQRAKRRSEADFNDEPPYIRGVEVGPGVKLPDRGSSLAADDTNRREKRSSRSESKSLKPRPDPAKTRTWTDRSGSFKVEAQFIGLSDGKIHLHKANGVKIAVPVAKMAPDDLAYVEKAAGVSLDEDKPLGDLKRRKRPEKEAEKNRSSKSGASVELPKQPEYDWFDFFLKAGVGPHQCERYTQNMNKDSMDESNLPDVTSEVLRTLGLKEGDILRVMKYLDTLYGRAAKSSNPRSVSFAENGDGENTAANDNTARLFTDADGTLRNNTRKARPESNRAVSDVVDAKAFEQPGDRVKSPPADSRATPLTSAPAQEKGQSGFDDDAWEVKPSKQSNSRSQPTYETRAPSSTTTQPQLSGAMAELSLLSPPLQPTVASPQPPQPPQQQQQQQQQQSQAQPIGATTSFFGQLNPQQTGLPGSQAALTQPSPMQPQNTNLQQIPQLNVPRQRPQAPQQVLSPGALLPPPRPLSAPQNFPQQSHFGPPTLKPQLTGIPRTSTSQAPPGHSLNDLSQQRLQQQFSQQQQQQQPQPQVTGFPQQVPGSSSFPSGVMLPGQQFSGPQQQPYLNGNATGSPFADPRPQFQPQPTSFANLNQQGTQPGGINSLLPAPLQPQPTSFHQQQQQQQQPQQIGFLQPQHTSYAQQPSPGLQQSQSTGFQQQASPGFQQPQQTGFGQPPQQNGFTSSASSSFQAPPVSTMPQQQQPTPAPLQPQKTGPAPPVRFGVSDAKKLTPQPTGRRANLAHASKFSPLLFSAYLSSNLVADRDADKRMQLRKIHLDSDHLDLTNHQPIKADHPLRQHF
jgi:actin cytoskeleton-regulatory complex protein SLA1